MKTKNYITYIILSLLLLTTIDFAQGITIGSETTFSLGLATMTVTGNWNNSGTLNAGDGTVIFAGSSGNQTITRTDGETFSNLIVNKTAGDVQLLSNIAVNGSLAVTSGDVDMNGNTLTLGSSASISEAAGHTVKGNGSLTTTRTLNAPSSENIMGLEITSGANLGSTVITRGHAVQTGESNNSILRYFHITPANNSGLNASLVFHYDDSELNSLTEAELIPFRSEVDGVNWTLIGGSAINTTDNTVSFSGLASLSKFTLGASSAPLPVELTDFNASTAGNNVILNWSTATEINNYGFEVERLSVIGYQSSVNKDNLQWELVGFVEGNGNSNSPKEYSFIDKSVVYGEYSYRIKQIDNDGTVSYSTEVKVQAGSKLTAFKLSNYPDPFNPETTIRLELPEASNVNVSIYNALGERVAVLFNGQLKDGVYETSFSGRNLASGMYIMTLNTDKNVSLVKKIMLVK